MRSIMVMLFCVGLATTSSAQSYPARFIDLLEPGTIVSYTAREGSYSFAIASEEAFRLHTRGSQTEDDIMIASEPLVAAKVLEATEALDAPPGYRVEVKSTSLTWSKYFRKVLYIGTDYVLFSRVDSDEPYSAVPMDQIRLISWLSPTPRVSLRTTRVKIPANEESADSGSDPGNPETASNQSPIPLDDKMMKYAKRIVERYDRNKDGMLEDDEWDKMLMSPVAADADRDGKITQTEYAEWMRARATRE